MVRIWQQSGKEGDLDELSKAVRQVCFDLEGKEESERREKSKKEETKKDLQTKEDAVLTGQVQQEIADQAKMSRSKRKAGALSGILSPNAKQLPRIASFALMLLCLSNFESLLRREVGPNK